MLESIKNAVGFAVGLTAALGATQGLFDTNANAQSGRVAKAWTSYEQAFKNNQPLPMPDYSHAGFALCPESVNAPDLPVLHIKDFGGLPNDKKSDREALQAAIEAAEKLNGAVIQFAAGRYFINEEAGLKKGLTITGDNIVLRGHSSEGGTSGDGASGGRGTELFMRHHLVPQDPKKMWSTPPMIGFKLHSSKNKRPTLCKITSDSPQETFSITVDRIDSLKAGQIVSLESRNPQATDRMLAGLKPWSIWTETIDKGARISEKHRITSIDGNRVTFQEPIHIDIYANDGWSVNACPLAKGWRVENITFRGQSPHPFVHHKNAMHDSGWNFLSFGRGYAPVLSGCRFINGSGVASFSNCYGATAIHNMIEGHQGHSSIASGGSSYGTLIAFCIDRVKGGSFHGFAANAGAAGTVIYHCKSSDRGFDWHGSWPYTTLIDKSSGGLVGNGGNSKVLPNHMQDLTFWNLRQTAGKVYKKMDWWEPRRGNESYSGPKIVLPRIVGYHGLPTTFLPKHCLLIESHGRPVQPASLFEAQLELRSGGLPAWLVEGKSIFNQAIALNRNATTPTASAEPQPAALIAAPKHKACDGSCQGPGNLDL